jgi:hypothetical protein
VEVIHFLAIINYNWDIMLESMWSIGGVLLGFWQDSIRSPGTVSILIDSIRSLPGVYLESSRNLE